MPGAPPVMLIVNRPLPITWKTLHDYAGAQSLSDDDFELFLRFLRALDDEYLTILAEQRSGQSSDTGNENADD